VVDRDYPNTEAGPTVNLGLRSRDSMAILGFLLHHLQEVVSYARTRNG
jgi:hypothetical protein